MKLNEKNVRLFRSDWMESLTHVPVWLPATLWLPVIGFLLFQTYESKSFGFFGFMGIAIAGLLCWTFTEYMLHRFLFHAEFKNPKLQRMVFLLHGVHHDYPNDSERLLMPPLAAIPIAILFWGLFSTILGREVAVPFFAFFLLGYLIYDYIHFGTHHFRIFSSDSLKKLKKHHMDHHFKAPDLYYGVSSPLWDMIFGTLR